MSCCNTERSVIRYYGRNKVRGKSNRVLSAIEEIKQVLTFSNSTMLSFKDLADHCLTLEIRRKQTGYNKIEQKNASSQCHLSIYQVSF